MGGGLREHESIRNWTDSMLWPDAFDILIGPSLSDKGSYPPALCLA